MNYLLVIDSLFSPLQSPAVYVEGISFSLYAVGIFCLLCNSSLSSACWIYSFQEFHNSGIQSSIERRLTRQLGPKDFIWGISEGQILPQIHPFGSRCLKGPNWCHLGCWKYSLRNTWEHCEHSLCRSSKRGRGYVTALYTMCRYLPTVRSCVSLWRPFNVEPHPRLWICTINVQSHMTVIQSVITCCWWWNWWPNNVGRLQRIWVVVSSLLEKDGRLLAPYSQWLKFVTVTLVGSLSSWKLHKTYYNAFLYADNIISSLYHSPPGGATHTESSWRRELGKSDGWLIQ